GRLGEGAVAAAVAAERGERDEDLGGVGDPRPGGGVPNPPGLGREHVEGQVEQVVVPHRQQAIGGAPAGRHPVQPDSAAGTAPASTSGAEIVVGAVRPRSSTEPTCCQRLASPRARRTVSPEASTRTSRCLARSVRRAASVTAWPTTVYS